MKGNHSFQIKTVKVLLDMANAGQMVLDGRTPGEEPFKFVSSTIQFVCGKVNYVENITFSEGSLSIAFPAKKPALEEKMFIDYQVYWTSEDYRKLG